MKINLISLAAFLFLSACTSFNGNKTAPSLEKKGFTIAPLESVCTSQHKPLEYWVKRMPAILMGEVAALTPKLPSTPVQGNSCWVKLIHVDWLKDDGGRQIWLLNSIDAYDKVYEDFVSLQYCDYEIGKRYIIFALHAKDTGIAEAREMIKSGSNKGALGRWFCPPNWELSPYSTNSIINDVKRILSEEKAT